MPAKKKTKVDEVIAEVLPEPVVEAKPVRKKPPPKKKKVVVPEPEPVLLSDTEEEEEVVEDDTFLLHRDDELEPEPEPVKPRKLRPCERVRDPEKDRLYRERMAIERAKVIEYRESRK